MITNLARMVAGALANSFLFAKSRRLLDLNRNNVEMALSKLEKVWCGSFLILKDYSVGRFPPVYSDRLKVYQGECDYSKTIPGITSEQFSKGEIRKPFWGPDQFEVYSKHVVRLLRIFQEFGLDSRSRILELGCGSAWLAEFLVLADIQSPQLR
jgi:hypothetical protein